MPLPASCSSGRAADAATDRRWLRHALGAMAALLAAQFIASLGSS
jgi:hypothetical protein